MFSIYIQVSNDLPKPELAVLHEMEKHFHSLPTSSASDTKRLQAKYIEYMRKAKSMCRDVWAKFDNNLMTVGCLHVLFCIMLQISIISGFVISTNTSTIVCQVLLTGISLVLSYLAVPALYSLIIIIFSSLLTLVYCSSVKAKLRKVGLCDWLSIFCLFLLCLGSLSNSMLINEDRITFYLVQSVIAVNCISNIIVTLRQQHRRTKEKNQPHTYLTSILKLPSTSLLIVITLIIIVSQLFRACREEQYWCEPSLLLKPLPSLSQELSSYKNTRFWFLSVPSLVIPVLSVSIILRSRGNLNGYSAIALFASYALAIMSALIFIHWASSSSVLLSVWQRTIFARLVYFMLICGISITFISPIAVYMSEKKKTAINGHSIPSLYQFMKHQMSSNENEESRPLVYGLSTVYSASYLVLVTAVALYLMMISGDGMSMSQCALLIAAIIYLDLHKLRSANRPGKVKPLSVPSDSCDLRCIK